MRALASHLRSATLVWMLALGGVLPAAAADQARLAPPEQARAVLQTGITEITTALRAPSQETDLLTRLDALATTYFAFETTTRLAVGPTWRDFSAEQREQATRLFSQLVIRTYAERLRGEAAAAPSVDYGKPVELRSGRVEVPTKTRSGGPTYDIAYRLEAIPGGWRIYDVVAEGVSLVGNYRAQFEPVLARGGAPALLRAIEAKLAESAP